MRVEVSVRNVSSLLMRVEVSVRNVSSLLVRIEFIRYQQCVFFVNVYLRLGTKRCVCALWVAAWDPVFGRCEHIWYM
jgi:hypothetical protein